MAVRYGHLFQAREKQLTDAVEAAFRQASPKPPSGISGGKDVVKMWFAPSCVLPPLNL